MTIASAETAMVRRFHSTMKGRQPTTMAAGATTIRAPSGRGRSPQGTPITSCCHIAYEKGTMTAAKVNAPLRTMRIPGQGNS